jgi:hypothetical protein
LGFDELVEFYKERNNSRKSEKKASEGTKHPLEASSWMLLETLPHNFPKRVKGQVVKLIQDIWEPVT